MKPNVLLLILLLLCGALAPGPVWGQTLDGVRIEPASPGKLVFGQRVTVSFTYKDLPGPDLRIYVRPYTGSFPSPGYAADGSPAYPAGSGVGSGSFTIRTGDPVTVDSIKVSVSSGNRTLFAVHLPVAFDFTALQVGLVQPMRLLSGATVTPGPNPTTGGVLRMKPRPLLRPHLQLQPRLVEKLVPVLPFDLPDQEMQQLMSQVPSIRPPNEPTNASAAWSEEMDAWMDELNRVLFTEIQLVVGDQGVMQGLLEFEGDEQVDVYDQVGLRLYFLGVTQSHRLNEVADANQP